MHTDGQMGKQIEFNGPVENVPKNTKHLIWNRFVVHTVTWRPHFLTFRFIAITAEPLRNFILK
jgi:hypothetical protein